MKVITNSIIYFGVGGFQSFLSFLLLPVYTSFLGTYEFGLVNVINSVASLLGLIFIFGANAAISRLYFEYREEPDKLKNFLSTIFLGKILMNLLIAGVFISLRSLIFPILAEGVSFYPYLLVAIGIGFFSTIFTLSQTLQQTRQDGLKYAIYQGIYLLLNNGLSVLFLVVFDLQGLGIVLGTLLSTILMDLLVLFSLRKSLALRVDKKIFVESLKYSSPLAIHAIFVWGSAAINKLILNNLSSTSEVGIYSIGFVIGGIVSTIAVAVNRSYTPWFFEQMKRKKQDNSDVVRFAEFIVLIYSVLAMLLSLFAPEVIRLFVSEEFHGAWIVVPVIAFAYVFDGLYFFFIDIFNYGKKYVRYVPIFSLSAAIINIAFNYLLIPRFGMVGSACATLISMVFLSSATFLASRKLINVKFSYLRLLYIVLIPALFTTAVYIDLDLPIFQAILVKVGYSLFALLVLYLLHRKVFNENMLHQVVKLKKFFYGFKRNKKRIK